MLISRSRRRRARRARRSGDERRVHRRHHRHAARSSAATCSSRCAASASTATRSSTQALRRRRGGGAGRARAADAAHAAAAARRATTRALALGALAAHWRARFALPLVALTGSNGKTTVKEMLAAILRAAAAGAATPVLATRGNLNNDIGMPLTLLELRARASLRGDRDGHEPRGRDPLPHALAQPDVALVTNAGRAHIGDPRLARRRSRARRARSSKASATTASRSSMPTIAFAGYWRDLDRGAGASSTSGSSSDADVTATLRADALESEIVAADARRRSSPSTLHVPGVHNVRNALAAARRGLRARDPGRTTIAAGLAALRRHQGPAAAQAARCSGATLIDDTYNANPESMRAAIACWPQAPAASVLVLGDMGELGDDARGAARRGRRAARSEPASTRCSRSGELVAAATRSFGAGAHALRRRRRRCCAASRRAGSTPDTTVLVKGSRFMRWSASSTRSSTVSRRPPREAALMLCC